MRLIESLATTELLAEVFSDQSALQAMLDFEVALARAEAELQMIPRSAASAIAKVARAEHFEVAALGRETLRAGTPGIPLVKALRKKVQQVDKAAADFVHSGATSQDVSDTALVLLLQKCVAILDGDLNRLEVALQGLVAQHKDSVMLGRTLLQPTAVLPKVAIRDSYDSPVGAFRLLGFLPGISKECFSKRLIALTRRVQDLVKFALCPE